jgi:hypothetical protein
MGPTLTQNIFACCLCLFGPGFGFWGAYICRDTRLGAIWGFVIAAFIAYAGWFISGLVALNLYPHYGPGSGDPPESVAVLFAIPGFITGLLGVGALRRFTRTPAAGGTSGGSPRPGETA